MTEEYKALLKSKGIRCLKLPLISRGEGGDEPSEPKITCVFGEPEFGEQEPYEFQAQCIYAKIENYEVNNPGVYVFLLDFNQEAYDAIAPGDELDASEYADYGRDLTENTNPEYSEYQYYVPEQFYYEGLRYGIVLVDDYDEEKGTIRAIAKTQFVKPVWTVEISNASATFYPLSSKAGITANLNRHLVLYNPEDGETEQVGVSPSPKEVGADVTDDADVAYYPYGTGITSDGVEVGDIEGYTPSDKLYLVTVVNTYDMTTFDPVKIVTACSEEITIPASAVE